MGLLAGIIEGGLGGGGQALQNIAQSDIDTQHRQELAQQASDLELAKMKAAEDYKVQIANQMREAQVGRVNAAMPGIVDSQLAGQYPALPGAEDGGDNGLRNAQDSAATAARAQLMADPHTRVAAAEATGDVPIGTAATLLQRSDNSQNMLQWRMDHNETLRQNADLRANTQAQIAAGNQQTRLMVAELAHQAHASDDKEAQQNMRLLLSDTSRNIDETRKQLNDVHTQLVLAPNDPDLKSRASDLTTQLTNLSETHGQLAAALAGKVMGGKGASTAAPAPAPAPAADINAPEPNPDDVLFQGTGMSAPRAAALPAGPVSWNSLKK